MRNGKFEKNDTGMKIHQWLVYCAIHLKFPQKQKASAIKKLNGYGFLKHTNSNHSMLEVEHCFQQFSIISGISTIDFDFPLKQPTKRKQQQ